MDAQSLIAKYAVKQATFPIELMSVDETGKPSIDTLTVRQVKSTEEMRDIKVKGLQFARMLQNTPPAAFTPFLPVTEATAEMVICVSELVIEPKVSQLDALQMAQEAGQLLAHIFGQIMARNTQAAGIADTEAIEEAKKLLAEMSSGEATSPSDAMPLVENTPIAGTPPTGDTPATGTP